MTMFKWALLRVVRKPGSLIANSVLPVALVLIPDLWTDGATNGFFLMGMVIMTAGYFVSGTVAADRRDDSLTRVLTGPVTLTNYLAQNLLASMVPLLVQILLVGGLGAILYGWALDFTLMLMFTYFLFAISSVAFAYGWNTLFKSKTASGGTFTTLMTLIAFFGGLMVPLEALPDILRNIGAIFPAQWLTRSLGYLLASNIGGEFWLAQGILVLFTVAFLLFGGKRKVV